MKINKRFEIFFGFQNIELSGFWKIKKIQSCVDQKCLKSFSETISEINVGIWYN